MILILGYESRDLKTMACEFFMAFDTSVTFGLFFDGIVKVVSKMGTWAIDLRSMRVACINLFWATSDGNLITRDSGQHQVFMRVRY